MSWESGIKARSPNNFSNSDGYPAELHNARRPCVFAGAQSLKGGNCHEPLTYLIHYPEILTVPLSPDISYHSPHNYSAFIFPHSSSPRSLRSFPHPHMLTNIAKSKPDNPIEKHQAGATHLAGLGRIISFSDFIAYMRVSHCISGSWTHLQ